MMETEWHQNKRINLLLAGSSSSAPPCRESPHWKPMTRWDTLGAVSPARPRWCDHMASPLWLFLVLLLLLAVLLHLSTSHRR